MPAKEGEEVEEEEEKERPATASVSGQQVVSNKTVVLNFSVFIIL